jgi:hypothetical protein
MLARQRKRPNAEKIDMAAMASVNTNPRIKHGWIAFVTFARALFNG